MGMVHADIELVNLQDIGDARRCMIGEEEVRRIQVRALVDTGCYFMAINENLQSYLDLTFIARRTILLANGQVEEYDFVGPLGIKYAGRTICCDAIVLPGDSEPLLGAIPIEQLDAYIDPRRQELILHEVHKVLNVFKAV